MGFSNNAIGFFLQLEDQVSPKTPGIARGYSSFVKKMDTYNRQLFKSTTKGIGSLDALAKSLKDLPKTALKSYGTMMRTLQRQVRPLKQPIEFTTTGTGKKKFQDTISEAVARAFEKATIKLSATVPSRRSKLFDTSVGLRQLYKKIPQPPDLQGRVSIPGYAKGRAPMRVARGAGPRIDDQLAVLARDELVAPADAAKRILDIAGQAKNLAGKFTALPADFDQNLARVQNLMKAIPLHQGLANTGLNPASAKLVKSGLKEADVLMKKLIADSTSMNKTWRMRLLPVFSEMNQSVKTLKHEADGALGPVEKLLGKILTPTQMIATMEGIRGFKDAIGGTHSGLSSAANVGGLASAAEGFVGSMNDINSVLQLSGKDFDDFETKLMNSYRAIRVGTRDLGKFMEVVSGLVHRGVGKDLSVELAGGIEQFSAATHSALGPVEDLSTTLAQKFNLSVGDTIDQLGLYQKIAAKAKVAGGTIIDTLSEATKEQAAFFQGLSPEASKTALSTLAKIAAAGESAHQGFGKDLVEMLTRGISNPNAMPLLAGVFGKNPGQIQAMLKSGNTEALLETVRTLQGANPMQFKAFAEVVGIDADKLRDVATFAGKAADSLKTLNPVMQKTGQGTQDLSDAAANATTWYQRLGASIKNWISGSAAVNYAVDASASIGGHVANITEGALGAYAAIKGPKAAMELLWSSVKKGGGMVGRGGAAAGRFGVSAASRLGTAAMAAGTSNLASRLGSIGAGAIGTAGRLAGGPLALLLSTQGSLGGSGDEDGGFKDIMDGKVDTTSYAAKQLAMEKQIYAEEHPFKNALFGFDADTPGLLAAANARLAKGEIPTSMQGLNLPTKSAIDTVSGGVPVNIDSEDQVKAQNTTNALLMKILDKLPGGLGSGVGGTGLPGGSLLDRAAGGGF